MECQGAHALGIGGRGVIDGGGVGVKDFQWILQ